VKIENMKEQHRKNSEANDAKKAEAPVEEAAPQRPEPVDPEEGVGFVAVAAGEGLHALFSDLGCAQVVSGGQTMNPSTNDIVDAIRAVPATTVFVLPNNKNIVMAAQQAIDICTERKVIVLPTRTIPQGMSAMLAYDPDSDDETNTELMLEAAGNVSTGQVTFAARDSDFGGFKIKEGDMLAMDNGKLVFTEKEDPVKTTYRLVRSMATRDTAFVTVIYGEDVTEADAEAITAQIQAQLPDAEVICLPGGQPVYHYIFSVE
jgi:dihydroxyacetone kinase-like predicted kinase